jgi:N,N'-diacetylchitobiose transport system substrate-binding protein
MKRRSIAALSLVAVLAAALTAATSGAATKKTAANSITVWLQVDAQSGWPDLVAAANKQFQADHPGATVNVQYQNWGDHLQKFDATLAGGGGADVIEMGNTEMTKYMAAGAFAALDKSQFDNSANWLKGLAASGKFGGKVYGVPYYAGSRVVTYRTDLFKQAGIAKLPTTTAEYAADAKKLLAKNTKKGFSPVYIAVFTWFANRWRNHRSKRAEKPHSITQWQQSNGAQAYDRSCEMVISSEIIFCRGALRGV